MSIRKIWNIKQSEVSKDMLQACGGNSILASLLSNRKIDTPEKINNFLNPLKAPLSSPDVFVDMKKAFDRIKFAVENNEQIIVYGDFDSDGVTATSLLYLTLKKIGANVDFYLPDRATESHGLNTKALVQLIAKRKTKLIITVDCGISNVQEVAFAKGFKTDVIITDHHEAPEILPDAFAIINPKAPNSLNSDLSVDEIQSLNFLAGVGVAFKLACKLLDEYSFRDFAYDLLPLVAVGTIGDVVELLCENRTLVEMGLELLRKGKHIGIQKMLKEAGIEPSTLTSENIAFSIVPRLNAAGRLESPYTAIKILTSDDENVLVETVKILNDLNALRQELCDETYKQAKSMYLSNKLSNKKSIVLFNDNWHIGIIGIVSSKLVEEFNKPTFLMTRDANNTNIIRCSCRSIDEVNVHTILSQHKELFVGFGGHKLAAGFSFDQNKIIFDLFKNLLNKTIDEFTQDVDFKSTKIDVDMLIEPNDVSIENIEIINKLQPFGSANPSPLFAINSLTLKNYKFMGQNNNHLKFFVSKGNSNLLQCVKWNTPDFNLPEGSNLDILFSMNINTFNGETSPQLMISDIHSEFIKVNNTESEIKILDHRNKSNILTQVYDFISNTKKSTAIYIQNLNLKKELSLPEEIDKLCFSAQNIPVDIEQVFFFEIPSSKEELFRIINETNSQVLHLMNFSCPEISTDSLVSKLSGMLKYAFSNMSGSLNLYRISSALFIDVETLDIALSLLENCEMVDLDKNSDVEFLINNLNPVELSKVKNDELYLTLDERVSLINNFRHFYKTCSIAELKKELN